MGGGGCGDKGLKQTWEVAHGIWGLGGAGREAPLVSLQRRVSGSPLPCQVWGLRGQQTEWPLSRFPGGTARKVVKYLNPSTLAGRELPPSTPSPSPIPVALPWPSS